MNWRKPLIYMLLYCTGNKIPKILKELSKWEFSNSKDLINLHNEQLKGLLLHAYQNVPYYRQILSKSEVVIDGQVHLENFKNIPLLTKNIIRKEGENLYSSDYHSRKSYVNTSGGSTGESVKFIQDAEYDQWNIATKLYFNMVLGKQPGQSEIKFWGSDRDIIKGNLSVKDRAINYLYNRKFFNSYRLGSDDILKLIHLNNRFKPKAYWSYMESAVELADFISNRSIKFYPPNILISTIGPLTEALRAKIEKSMQCKVYNQYGSREVGAIACECQQQDGLHTFPWWNHVELLDENGKIIKQGQGKVVVTTLHNYSMPLI